MRICFLVGQLGLGGAEKQLFYYLKILKNFTDDLYLISLSKNDYWESIIRDLNIDIYHLDKKNKLIRIINLIKIIKQRPIDIIQSQHFYLNLYSYIISKLLNIISIGAARNDVYSEIKDVGRLGLLSLRKPNFILVNSQNAFENAKKCGKNEKELYYLPNVIDTKYYSFSEKSLSEKINIISIGTLWKPKRIDKFVNLSKKFLDQNISNIFFHIYGEGELRADLENYAQIQGVLNKNLFFHGAILDSRDAYKKTDILVLTSDHEGTPNVILEAMALGLAIISTKVGDIPDIVTNEINGLLVENEDDLFYSLMYLIEHPNLIIKYGIENRTKIEEEYSFASLEKKLLNFYRIVGFTNL